MYTYIATVNRKVKAVGLPVMVQTYIHFMGNHMLNDICTSVQLYILKCNNIYLRLIFFFLFFGESCTVATCNITTTAQIDHNDIIYWVLPLKIFIYSVQNIYIYNIQ